eukprot:253624_1
MKLFLLSTSAMLIANGIYAAQDDINFAQLGANYQCNIPDDKSQTTCESPRIAFTCEGGELACCEVTMTPGERQRVRNRNTRDSTLRQLGTVNLNGHGTCTAAAEDIPGDISSSPDEVSSSPIESSSEDEVVDTPPEEEYDAELDEEFEFAMTERQRNYGCRRDRDCSNRNDVCRHNICVRRNKNYGCRRDRDCSNRNDVCRNNICVRRNNDLFCRNDSQCRNRNDYCKKNRNRCERASGRRCSQGTDCGNGQGSQWMCRQGRCQPRSLFEMAMMETE